MIFFQSYNPMDIDDMKEIVYTSHTKGRDMKKSQKNNFNFNMDSRFLFQNKSLKNVSI